MGFSPDSNTSVNNVGQTPTPMMVTTINASGIASTKEASVRVSKASRVTLAGGAFQPLRDPHLDHRLTSHTEVACLPIQSVDHKSTTIESPFEGRRPNWAL